MIRGSAAGIPLIPCWVAPIAASQLVQAGTQGGFVCHLAGTGRREPIFGPAAVVQHKQTEHPLVQLVAAAATPLRCCHVDLRQHRPGFGVGW